MNPGSQGAAAATSLPALRVEGAGARHVHLGKILALAAPLFLNSAVQALLNLTDTWFIGRLSTSATAAMGAVYFLVLVFVILAGGIGMAVQILVAQAYGARRKRRAAAAVWAGQWAALATVPPFLVLAWAGRALLTPFGLMPVRSPTSLWTTGGRAWRAPPGRWRCGWCSGFSTASAAPA